MCGWQVGSGGGEVGIGKWEMGIGKWGGAGCCVRLRHAASHYPLPTPSSKEESEGASRRTGSKRPSRPLPDDWTPRDQERRAATAKGIDPDALADDMRNWAQAKDERRVDWDATFRTFISREKPSRNTDPLNKWQQAFNSLAADEYPDHYMIEGAS